MAAAGKRPLGTCDVRSYEFDLGPFVMVIFGGAGDLACRKLLPALYYLYRDARGSKKFTVLGVGIPAHTDDEYRALARASLKKFSPEIYEPRLAGEFTKNLFYLSGDVADGAVYRTLCQSLKSRAESDGVQAANITIYLAVPPQLVPVIVEHLKKAALCRNIRGVKLVVEKPFGKDRASADQLDRQILEAFNEQQVFRIDHYLAKETVQNILFFRFGNSIFEPLWNARFIDQVQITVAEDIGIEHRGAFYEEVGVIRDIVQNHLMQVLALVAMEPPAAFDADLVRNEKSKVFHSIRRFDGRSIRANTVCGQYGAGRIGGREVRAYRQEEHVSPRSKTATFFAGKFYIDNWRWAGVPFYLRTGKRLPRRVSEIYIGYKQHPLRLFGKTCDLIRPNGLVLSIQPQEGISLALTVKRPGIGDAPAAVSMDFDYAESFHAKQHPAYERVIADCIKGDLTLFPRQDEVDTTWSLLDPVIRYWETHPPARLPNYAAGTWGPVEAFRFMAGDGRTWRLSDDNPAATGPAARPARGGRR